MSIHFSLSMSAKLALYSYWRSSCSWRVRAVLDHKKLPYEYIAVNLTTGEQHSEEFKHKNPLGYVPTLQIESQDGHTEHLFESLAIIDYLEQRYPEHSVYPADLTERAKVATVVNVIVSGIQPIQNLAVMKKVEEFSGSKEKSVQWSAYWIGKKFAELERFVSQTSGKYTVGDQLTLADMCLAPQVYNAIRFKVDMATYPTLKRLYDFLLTESGPVERTSPEHQPDCPV